MVLIIDYGMGNTGSVKRAFEENGADNVVISNNPKYFDLCTHAVLPGVGSFSEAMKNLNEYGLIDKIKKLAIEDKIPLLGICLGMQLFANSSEENGYSKGLELIPGEVKLLCPINKERVPHVGWNEIRKSKNSILLNGVDDGSDYYFVHSYHFIPFEREDILTITPYCGTFISSIERQNVFGTQFHPEKSSINGFKIIKNFLSL